MAASADDTPPAAAVAAAAVRWSPLSEDFMAGSGTVTVTGRGWASRSATVREDSFSSMLCASRCFRF